MRNPWLSIICPVYNGEKFLPQTLDSIAIQQDKEIECICIDDGSTDSTLAILESFQHKIPIKVVHKNNRNWVANTNHAIQIAKGEYLCFLHQDDIWVSERLSKLRSITKKHPEIGLIIHPSVFISETGLSLGTWNCPLPSYPAITPSQMLIERLLIQNFISIPGTLFKKGIVTQTEGMNEVLWYTADWDFWLQIANKTDAIYIPSLLSGFRIHPNSQTVLGSIHTIDFQKQLEFVLYKHIDKLMVTKSKKEKILKTAEFSIQINVTLAKILHHDKANYLRILFSFLNLGLAQSFHYFRDSRILERIIPRFKENLRINKT